MSRASKAYVSGYNRTQVISVRLIPTEQRSLVANFRAALDGQTIVTARWQLDVSGVATLASPTINAAADQTSVTLDAYRWGCVPCRCTVTLSDGSILTQLYAVQVAETDFFNDAVPGGSLDVTVSA